MVMQEEEGFYVQVSCKIITLEKLKIEIEFTDKEEI